MVDQKLIEEKHEQRYAVLRALYNLSSATEHIRIPFPQLVEATDLIPERVTRALNYLVAEMLAEWKKIGGFSGITHKGICEVEETMTCPNGDTEHFPVTVIQNFHAPVGAVQTGRDNTANVTQQFNLGTEEILQLINRLRETIIESDTLSSVPREEVLKHLKDLQVEVEGESGSSKLRSSLLAIWEALKKVPPVLNQLLELAKKLNILIPPA